MSEIKHTPTPWVAGWGEGLTGPTTPARPVTVGGADWDYEPVSFGYETIAICPNQVSPWSLRNEAKGTGKANAAFIVTAVNAYDKQRALIETLNAALLAMTSWLMVVSDHLELDPEETRVNVRVIGPDGSRDFASRSLLEITEQATIALEAAKEITQ